jgi:hypothetical protein
MSVLPAPGAGDLVFFGICWPFGEMNAVRAMPELMRSTPKGRSAVLVHCQDTPVESYSMGRTNAAAILRRPRRGRLAYPSQNTPLSEVRIFFQTRARLSTQTPGA